MATTQANPVLGAIDEGIALSDSHVTVYFARDGEEIDFVTNEGDWSAYHKASAMAALDAWAAVSGLTFSEAGSAEAADFKLTKSPSEHGSLGFMSGPDPELDPYYRGIAWFNSHDYWSGPRKGMLDPGAYMHTILLHEFGHGLGLAHPHDDTAGSDLMPRVGEGLGLDQGVYTVMTYNDGWPEAPEGLPESRAWGWNLGPSALDIAVVQEKYGVNADTGAGNDRYRLPSENGPGTGYLCIWDAGGERDLIFHKGREDAVIDLRAATLEAEPGGGGWVSRVEGIHGGVTIAYGVTIERGFGGRGDDAILGNAADNRLKGRKGQDRLEGGDGDDVLLGGRGGDRLFGGDGDDRLKAGKGRDVLTGGEGEDVFVLRPGDGRTVIRDLSSEDRLNLRALDYTGFEALQDDLRDRGGRTVLKEDGLALVLRHVDPDDLVEDMLLL